MVLSCRVDKPTSVQQARQLISALRSRGLGRPTCAPRKTNHRTLYLWGEQNFATALDSFKPTCEAGWAFGAGGWEA